jgi:hypothetical protein
MGRFATDPSTRIQRFVQKFGNIPYTASGNAPTVDVPKSDYTTYIDIVSNQQVVAAGTAPVIAGMGAWGPLGVLTLKTNGNRHPFTMPAYHADIYNRIRRAPYTSNLTADPVTISTTNNWTGHLRIPLTCVPDMTVGAFYTGDTSVTLTMQAQNYGTAVAFSTVNGATIQGSWDLYREIFQAPQPDQPNGWLSDISYYHEVSIQSTVNLQNGVNKIVMPVNQDYMRILLVFYTGNNFDATFAPADGLYTTVDLVANDKIHLIDTIFEADMRFDMAQSYREVLPAGTCVVDFMRVPNSRRDVLPTDSPTLTDLNLNINSTSGSNKVDVIIETVVDSPFATKWIASAQALAAGQKAA